jgi:hypothetical protein
LLRIEHVQRTQLVADDARRTIHWPGEPDNVTYRASMV